MVRNGPEVEGIGGFEESVSHSKQVGVPRLLQFENSAFGCDNKVLVFISLVTVLTILLYG